MLWGVYHKGMSCAESGGVLALAMGTTGTYVLGAAQESPVGMDGDAVRVPKFNRKRGACVPAQSRRSKKKVRVTSWRSE